MENLAFKILLAVVVMLQNSTRFYFQVRYKQSHKHKVTVAKPTREQLLVAMMASSYMVSSILWWFTPILNFANIDLPILLRYAGFVLGLFSCWYFYRVHKTLGDNWSPVLEIRKEHQVISTGLYKYLRHPMYTSMLCGILATFLISANWLLFVVMISALTILLVVRIPDEEKLMLTEFGEKYNSYMKTTKRLIPFIY
jgi:protein-S-isoprenylcysteine O-methyltransferase Ste14